MKIIAIIANDREPQGWKEVYKSKKHDDNAEAATAQMTRLVSAYNATLERADLPRRLLSLTLEEHSEPEAWDIGNKAIGYPDYAGPGDNYWPKDHPLHEFWEAGWWAASEAADSFDYDDE